MANVEELLARVNAARERLRRVPAILKRFRQAVLAAACSGRLTADWRVEHTDVGTGAEFLEWCLRERQKLWEKRNSAGPVTTSGTNRRPRYPEPFQAEDELADEYPETWVAGTVSQVAILDVGFAFKSTEFATSGVRLLRGENVEPGALRWEDVRYWPEADLDRFRHLLVADGDIILAMDRPVISSGLKLARATGRDVPCLLVQRVTRFKTAGAAVADYLYLCLQRDEFVSHLTGGLTGSDLPHITGPVVAQYIIPLPPAQEQQEIVRRANALFRLADAIERRVIAASARADRLTQSILAKAFRGELVPTEAELARREGRDYEPASALVERIRVEREVATNVGRGKR